MTDDPKHSVTSGSGPSPSIPSTRQDVEQQLLQELQPLDPRRPDFWLSDGPWSYFRVVIEMGNLAWFYLTQEKRIRNLALKYKAKPDAFRRAVEQAFQRHAKKLGIPWGKYDAPAESLSLQAGLSQRQLKAFKDFAPTLRQMALGGPSVAPSLEPRPKEISTIFRVLGSKPAGRARIDKYNEALKLYRKGERNFHEICRQTDPNYPNMRSRQQEKTRKSTRSAVYRRLQGTVKELGDALNLASEASSTKIPS